MSDFPKPFYKWRPQPWHGLDVGPNPPSTVEARTTLLDLVNMS